MSSEREKLIEIWLDSAGEREYQFAFRNALLFLGGTILHSTSHTSLELGKDIIAIGNGELAAYQLKGNPGSRLTISQWHELIPQINALVYQPVSHPNVRRGTRHQPYLVTNGEIHEDVYAAIAGYNAQVESSELRAKPLKTIARGEMLRMVLETADVVWPAELPTQRDILNMYASRGDDVASLELFSAILIGILKSGRYSASAVAAAHLVTSILASRWIEKKNYFEAMKLYAILCASAASYTSRWTRRRRLDAKFLEEITFDVRAMLGGFVRDYLQNYGGGRPPINSNIFSELVYFHPRKKIISGILSVAFLDKELAITEEERERVGDCIRESKHRRFLLSEGIVPFCLAELWALSLVQGTKDPDLRLISLLESIISCNGSMNESAHLPNPYYSFEEVLFWQGRPLFGPRISPIDDESHYRRSWFADAMFYLLVRRNYKRKCKELWPELTRFVHARTRLEHGWQFGLLNCDDAVSEDRILTSPKSWDDVVRESAESREPVVPQYLRDRPIPLLLYCLFVPYRMDKEVILWLDRAFARTWY
jgi:hypothetical protein